MRISTLAPIGILVLMAFTWLVAVVATFFGSSSDDGYDYEEDHISVPPQPNSTRRASYLWGDFAPVNLR
jgi:hypothetical protein